MAQTKCGASATPSFLSSRGNYRPLMNAGTACQFLPTPTMNDQVVYQIPVVVHVVHQGEPIGVGTNLPDSTIVGQINTLTKDFRRWNADTVDTPPIFRSVAADIKIEFVLAKRDPEGLPSTGIVRLRGGQAFYSLKELHKAVANNYWPLEEYLNLWVLDLTAPLIGHAKFPVSNLPGLSLLDGDPTIDGVYIDYMQFGTSKRTTTHEVGHWLGLLHTWGDGDSKDDYKNGCSVDDFCRDTPDQRSPTKGCPKTKVTCGNQNMFQNYMDYTDDRCMNLFTQNQRHRMRTVLQNSIRRKSLLMSQGAIEPVRLANDVGIQWIETPRLGNCQRSFQSAVRLRNYGTNAVNSLKVALSVNGRVQETRTVTKRLDLLQSTQVTFSSISVSQKSARLTFSVTSVNGKPDGHANNSCQWIHATFSTPQTIACPGQHSLPPNAAQWTIKNQHAPTNGWQFTQSGRASQATLDYQNTPKTFGALDYLISPAVDISARQSATLRLQFRYRCESAGDWDALRVMVSTDCGASFLPSDTVFYQKGNKLRTGLASRTVDVDISRFAAHASLVLAFVGVNGGRGRMTLEQVRLSCTPLPYDLALSQQTALPLVPCGTSLSANVKINHLGTQPMAGLTLSYGYGNTKEKKTLSGLNLLPGTSFSMPIRLENIPRGVHALRLVLSTPKGQPDTNPTNDSLTLYFAIDTARQAIPLRERFEQKPLKASGWLALSPHDSAHWKRDTVGVKNHALVHSRYQWVKRGKESWLISPLLDFSRVSAAAVFFEVSYAQRHHASEKLRVLASASCGTSFCDLLYEKEGSALAIRQTEHGWKPTQASHWRREYINLNRYVGQKDVRLAWVATAQNGNNLYLDNIEFYASDHPHPVVIQQAMSVYPNPATQGHVRVTFNFEVKEPVFIRLITLSGQIAAEQTYPSTLNQTYRLDYSNVITGLYILQVLGQHTRLAQKIHIVH